VRDHVQVRSGGSIWKLAGGENHWNSIQEVIRPGWGGGKILTLPSTHLCLNYHRVFGTKDHAPVIASAWRGDLHAFMGGLVRTLGSVPEAVVVLPTMFI